MIQLERIQAVSLDHSRQEKKTVKWDRIGDIQLDVIMMLAMARTTDQRRLIIPQIPALSSDPMANQKDMVECHRALAALVVLLF
jgi:hypothetical protein